MKPLRCTNVDDSFHIFSWNNVFLDECSHFFVEAIMSKVEALKLRD